MLRTLSQGWPRRKALHLKPLQPTSDTELGKKEEKQRKSPTPAPEEESQRRGGDPEAPRRDRAEVSPICKAINPSSFKTDKNTGETKGHARGWGRVANDMGNACEV